MICDRVAIIARGRIVNSGRLHDLISQNILFTEVTLSGFTEAELNDLGETLATPGGDILLKVYDGAECGQGPGPGP